MNLFMTCPSTHRRVLVTHLGARDHLIVYRYSIDPLTNVQDGNTLRAKLQFQLPQVAYGVIRLHVHASHRMNLSRNGAEHVTPS